MNRLAMPSPGSEPADGCAQPSLGRLLRRANRLVHTTVEARFGAADLNFTQWIALDLIGRAGRISAGDLAAAMDITTGALTRVADGLEARRLLARDRDLEDRRVVQLHLTLAGQAKLDEIWPVVVQRWCELLAGLSPDDVARLMALLNRLTESIERNVSGVGCSLAEA